MATLPGEPRIVVGEASEWPAVSLWTPQYLSRHAGGVDVAVREKRGTARNMYQNMAEGGTIPFAAYLDWVVEVAAHPEIRSHTDDASASAVTRAVDGGMFDTCYYLDITLNKLAASLVEDVRVPRWYGATLPIDTVFWCGVLGTSSGLHCDVKPNCNTQVAGRKHFSLFPPDQARRLYRRPGITHCSFDPNVPDFEAFPMARDAIGMECTIEPGECLYIPVGWFHQVTVVSAYAINVNFFWPRPLIHGIATPMLWRFLMRRLLARWRARLR